MSGSGKGQKELLRLVAGLRKHTLRPILFSNRDRLSAWLSDPARRETVLCLVAAGGDGTVHDVINRYPGVPLTTLGLGTENLLAKHLKLPTCGHALADVIAMGRQIRLDVGLANDRRFLLMASAGFDAEVVRTLATNRTGRIRKWTYLPHIWRALQRYPHDPFEVRLDDATEAIPGRLIVIMNLPAYGFGMRVADDACGNDGQFDVCIFDPLKPGERPMLRMLRDAAAIRKGAHLQLDHVRTVRAQKITVKMKTGEAKACVPAQLDGDPFGFLPLTVSILPAELDIIVPSAKNGER